MVMSTMTIKGVTVGSDIIWPLRWCHVFFLCIKKRGTFKTALENIIHAYINKYQADLKKYMALIAFCKATSQ